MKLSIPEKEPMTIGKKDYKEAKNTLDNRQLYRNTVSPVLDGSRGTQLIIIK